MQKIKRDGKKQNNYQLQIFLSEMGFFTNLKTKKTKLNQKPIKKTKQKAESEIPEFIDLHLDIISRIDEVIKKNEQQNIIKEEPIEKTTYTQIRKPWTIKPTRPLFRTENIQDNNENNTLFEVERNLSFNQNIQINNPTPLLNNVASIDEPLTVENINFVEKIDDNPNLLKGLGLSDRNTYETTTKQKAMDVKIAKTDLEKTKQELEIKKHELEEMMRLAKEKEEELKKKEEEEKKLEKLKKIKQKELEKEKKIKQRELEKENRKNEKQQLEEQKRQEKINKIKQKALEKEKKIKEKQQLEEQKRQEKIKEIEEKKLQKEQEIYKKQKEEEEKQKLKEKQEKIEEIINKKLKEKQKILNKQDKIENIELKDKDHEEKSDTIIEIKTKKKDKKIKPDYKTEDFLDEEVGEALRIIDNLLEKLPEDTIYEFIHSKDFEVYERVVNKYSKK